MYSPQSHGLVIEGGGRLTSSDEAYVNAVVRSFLNFKDVCSLDSIRKYYDLPDGGRFIVQHMGGIFKVMIYKQPSDVANTTDGLAKLYIPMLFCGGISSDAVDTADTEATVSVTVSSLTQKRLVHYDDDADLPEQTLALKRFNVSVNTTIVPEFASASHQYVFQRPTWYSGAMAEVMQIVGGYGKQLTKNANSDEDENILETVRFTMPDKTIEQIEEKLDGVRLPGYTGLPSSNGQFQYDYKFSQTHAVGFDANNEPWLLQITSSGLYAMPLPIIPATATSEFKDYVTEKGDTELLAILNRFGALPSGESFPTDSDDFAAWQRAGVIIKLCDMSTFYAKTAYSDSCGWTFNTTGSSGFNTCYATDSDGYKIGYAYGLTLTLNAATTTHGWISKITVPTDNAASVASYIGQLTALLDTGTARANAIQYKLRRSLDLIIERAGNGSTLNDSEVDYWHNLELDPIASHVGVLSKVGEGYLYYDTLDFNQSSFKYKKLGISGASFYLNPSSTQSVYIWSYFTYPQIYFPNVASDHSFNVISPAGLSLTDENEIREKRQNCDTIVYGYYVGDTLKVIKYYINWDKPDDPVDRTLPPNSLATYQRTSDLKYYTNNGVFYTTDLDFRLDGAYSAFGLTESVSAKMAKMYQTYGTYNTTGGYGILSRSYLFGFDVVDTLKPYSILNSFAVIPWFQRNTGLVYKYAATSPEVSYQQTFTSEIQDQYSYKYEVTSEGDVISEEVENSDGTKIVHDEGSWASVGGSASNYPTTTTTYYTPVIGESGDGGVWTQEYTIHGTPLDNAVQLSNSQGLYSSRYVDGCKVVFGTQQYVNIGLSSSADDRKSWGSTIFANNETAQHFIGVINE